MAGQQPTTISPGQQFSIPLQIIIPQAAPAGQYVWVKTQPPQVPTMTMMATEPAQAATTVTTTEEEAPVKKKKTWLWILLGLGGVALVAGIAVFLYYRNRSRAANQQNHVAYTDSELEHLAQTEAEAAAGYMTPVEAAAAAARAGGGSAEDVETAVLAAEHITPASVAGEVAQNLTEGAAVHAARRKLHLQRR